jgi:hypothetical protein
MNIPTEMVLLRLRFMLIKLALMKSLSRLAVATESIYLIFAPAEVSKVILKSDNNRLLAKDTRPEWKFELQDAKGNIIDLPVCNLTDNRLYDPEGNRSFYRCS